jgi:hypothetical protein
VRPSAARRKNLGGSVRAVGARRGGGAKNKPNEVSQLFLDAFVVLIRESSELKK